MVYTNEAVAQLGINSLNPVEIQSGVESLNGLSSLLSKDWLEFHHLTGNRSSVIVRYAATVWNAWCNIHLEPGAEGILEKWKSLDDFSKIHSIEMELLFLSRILSLQKPTKFFPEIDNKIPDAVVSIERRECFFEFSVRNKSEGMRRTDMVAQELADFLSELQPELHSVLAVNILAKDVNVEFIKKQLINSKIGKYFEVNNDIHYHAIPSDAEFPRDFPNIENFVTQPRVYCTSLRLGSLPMHKATTIIHVDDPYAFQKMSEEAKQLPKSHPGIIVLDISGVVKQQDEWNRVIFNQLSSGKWTRVSAVVLLTLVQPTDTPLKLHDSAIIVNPKAAQPLTQNELQFLENFVDKGIHF
ncbi:MAG: hypothetical protein AAB515_00785 [Patescibacteria group bacterium]